MVSQHWDWARCQMLPLGASCLLQTIVILRDPRHPAICPPCPRILSLGLSAQEEALLGGPPGGWGSGALCTGPRLSVDPAWRGACLTRGQGLWGAPPPGAWWGAQRLEAWPRVCSPSTAPSPALFCLLQISCLPEKPFCTPGTPSRKWTMPISGFPTLPRRQARGTHLCTPVHRHTEHTREHTQTSCTAQHA